MKVKKSDLSVCTCGHFVSDHDEEGCTNYKCDCEVVFS